MYICTKMNLSFDSPLDLRHFKISTAYLTMYNDFKYPEIKYNVGQLYTNHKKYFVAKILCIKQSKGDTCKLPITGSVLGLWCYGKPGGSYLYSS